MGISKLYVTVLSFGFEHSDVVLDPQLATEIFSHLVEREQLIYIHELQANVLVNDHRKAQLCDFGLATAVQEARTGVTTSHGFTGSIRWCSPEVMNDMKKTVESDMWSWGCLVLEVCPWITVTLKV